MLVLKLDNKYTISETRSLIITHQLKYKNLFNNKYDYIYNQLKRQMKTTIASRLSHKINWFPGHMRKALTVMQQNAKNVDVFIQIRDARLPYSTHNSQFDSIIKASQKQKIIIFNKIDICDQTKTMNIIKQYNQYGITCFGVSSQKHDDMRKIISILRDKYKSKYKQVGLWFMAYGMPNVGKSSILNQLRNISDLQNKRSPSKVTASVCTTKGTKGFKIFQKPLMYLMDSPGVSIPSVIPNQLGLKLALLGMIKQQVVQKISILQFLFEYFQKQKSQKFWRSLRVQRPKDFDDFFFKVRNRYKLYDYDAVCDKIITDFRDGKLGDYTIDDLQDIQK